MNSRSCVGAVLMRDINISSCLRNSAKAISVLDLDVFSEEITFSRDASNCFSTRLSAGLPSLAELNKLMRLSANLLYDSIKSAELPSKPTENGTSSYLFSGWLMKFMMWSITFSCVSVSISCSRN